MGFYAKKTLTGYKKVDGGAADQDAEYYIETKEEHEETLQRLRDAQESAHYARESVQKEKKRAAKEAERADGAERQIRQYAAQAGKRVSEAERAVSERDERITFLEGEVDALKKQLQSEKYLNRNMMRIMRERANQARGITPKKAHDGYIVLESRQWTEKYIEEKWDTEDHKERYGNANGRGYARAHGYLQTRKASAEVWKSILQTPYEVSLPINQVQYRIDQEIGDVLDDINVTQRLEPEYNGRYYDFGKDSAGYEINGMYRWKYKANYRAGLWELEIYTTKSLRVPEHRRPPKKAKGRKTKNKEQYVDDTGLDQTYMPDRFFDYDDDDRW